MGQSLAIPKVIPNDWKRLDLIVNKIKMRLGRDSSPTWTGITLSNTGLHLLDTDASHDLIIAPGSDLTADRTLTLTTGDSDRTITLSGNPTLDDWFDQSVKVAASPEFAGLTLTAFTGVLSAAAGVITGGAGHEKLANLDFASAGHTGFQAQGDVLDDLNATGANTFTGDPVNDFLVGTAAGTLVWQYGATARTSIGLGTGDNPTFAGLTLTNAAVIGSNSVVFQPGTDSTTFFQVLDADGGIPILNVDTTNERVGIGTISPYSGLHYQGDIFYLTPAAGPESNDNITIKNYATGNGAPDVILRTADIAGAYGIGVGTLSLIGGSKTTHYGGIGHGGGKISLQGGQGRDAANDPSYYAPVLLQPTSGNVGIGTTAPNAPLEVKGAKPGVVGGHQSGQLQVTGTGGEFYCAVITGHNSFNGNTQLWYLGSTSSATHDEIAFINRQNAAMHFYTNNTSRMTIDAAGNVTLATIAAEGSDVDKFLVSSLGVVKYRTGTQVLSDIGGQASDAGLSSLAGLTYAAAAFVKMTGANTFALRTLQETSDDLEATIDHDNLLNFAENEHYLQSAITQVGTIAIGVWEGTSISTTYTNAKCVAVWPDTYTADQNLLEASTPQFAKLGINVAAPASGLLNVYDAAINTTATYLGFYNYHQKTAGVTDVSNDFYGIYNVAQYNQSGGILGDGYGISNTFLLADGDIGDASNARFVAAVYNLTDLDGGKVYGDIFGFEFLIDQEAANEVTGNIYGNYIEIDADGTVGGSVYGLYLNEGSNVDYGIYQNGTAPNLFGGAVSITGNLTMTGNIIIPGDGTIGQAAGPLLTFDDTNDYLEITGCKVGIGTNTPTYELDVVKNQDGNTVCGIGNSSNGTSAITQVYVASDTAAFQLIAFSSNYSVAAHQNKCSIYGNIGASALQLWKSGNTPIEFWTNSTERMSILGDGGIKMNNLKSGTDQANAGAATDELYHDTDDNTIKIGV